MFASVIGTHQKIDKVAYRSLQKAGMLEGLPSLDMILHFEGFNGPDGIKRKSPSVDEPWHFYDPHNPADTALVKEIRGHYDALVVSLRAGNAEKSAFEASWLAHALVDGLTPAHHHEYETELLRIKGPGETGEKRSSVLKKLFIPAETLRAALRANWRYIGAKGLLSTHMLFEGGVALLAVVRRFRATAPEQLNPSLVADIGVEEVFMQAARKIATYDMYRQFYKTGWTFSLAKQVHQVLLPDIVQTVGLVWAAAASEAAS